MLYSFDVFDTLITRTTATPKGIFAIINSKLRINRPSLYERLDNNFLQKRNSAEITARKLFCVNGVEEITLEQIYHILSTMVYITSEELVYLKSLELETEIMNSVAINRNIDIVAKLIEGGDRVILISDMYLASEDIRKILVNHNPIFMDIPIYVSSEYKKTKQSGNLYKEIRKKELIHWEDWKHVGDNHFSDFERPISLGMEADYFAYSQLFNCEKELLENRFDDEKLQLFIGASRNTRLNQLEDVASYFGGMYGAAILFQYISWIIQLCEREGINKLYFVARDGYILFLIAELLKKKGLINQGLKYIYGSRSAWVTSGDIADDISDKGKYEKGNKELLLLNKYIKQEIDIEDSKLGFVEIHGRGEAQLCFCKQIRGLSQAELYAFYYILERNQNNDIVKFYRFTNCENYFDCIIEALTRALHGRTIGYDERDGHINPVLLQDDTNDLEEYGYARYIQSVLATIEEYVSVIKKNGFYALEFPFGKEYLDYLIKKEDGELLDFIADLPLSNTISGRDCVMSFAPKPSQYEIEKVKEIGYLDINAWCTLMSLRRLSDEELVTIDNNKKVYAEKRIPSKEIIVTDYVIASQKLKKKVVLYGAGKVGKSLYKYIIANNLAEIVAWCDKNVTEVNGSILYTDCLEKLDYEQIIIAVKSKDVAEDIMVDLISDGIDEKVIYWEDYKLIKQVRIKIYDASTRDKQKSVLIITDGLKYDGGAISSVNMAIVMKKKGYNVTIAAASMDERMMMEIRKKGISVISANRLPFVGEEELSVILQYELIIVNTFPMMCSANILCQYKPVLWWIHEPSEFGEYRFYSDTINGYNEYSDVIEMKKRGIRILAVSEVAKNAMNSFFPNSVDVILPMAINDSAISRELVYANEKLAFAMIGAINRPKGNKEFIKAYSKLRKKDNIDIEGMLIGKELNPVYAEEVKDLASDTEGIRLLGVLNRNELMNQFKEIDVVVCASYEETLSLTIIEGMMHSKICITTDNTGIAEYIEDGVNGFICKAGDVESLREKMQYVIDHFDELDDMRKKARQTYEKYFTLEVLGENLEREIKIAVEEFNKRNAK